MDKLAGVLGEADARPMGYGTAAKPPSYNVQIAVDPTSHIIVHRDVTTEATDNRLPYPMARATKAVLGAENCTGCPLKQNCTSAPRRFVYRLVHHAAQQRMTARVKADKSLMKTRRSTVEHPFGTLKQYLGGRFLLRGRLKAATETALAVLGYNLTRACKIVGRSELIERLA